MKPILYEMKTVSCKRGLILTLTLYFISKTSRSVKGSLSSSMKDNKVEKDLYCIFQKFVLIHFSQGNQDNRDLMMNEFHGQVNKVNKAVTKTRKIGDRLLLRSDVVCQKLIGLG